MSEKLDEKTKRALLKPWSRCEYCGSLREDWDRLGLYVCPKCRAKLEGKDQGEA